MAKQIFKGWHHYGVVCQKIEESIAYYQDALGFEFMYQCGELEGEDHIKLAFLKLDKIVLELLEPVSWKNEACEWAANDLQHLCLACGDIDLMKKKLEDEYNTEWELIEDGPECKAIFWRGPGGERLELIQMKTDLFPVMHSPTDTPYVRGLGHVGYFTGDLQASIDFYTNVLGFEHIRSFDEGGPNEDFWNHIALLKLNETLIEVIQPEAHEVIRDMVKYPSRMSMNHLGMEVACDMQEAIDCICSKAIVEWENTTPGISPDIGPNNDMQWALFRGPNGERWELSKDLGKNY